MQFREAGPDERQQLYEWGHREWPKGRTLDEYIRDNQKEESYGTRYVLADGSGMMASLMMLRFRDELFGFGSIVVKPSRRGQGLGKRLLVSCMDLEPKAAFLLYSEIGTTYYEQLGFRALPDAQQRFSAGICMAKASTVLFERIIREPVPDYF